MNDEKKSQVMKIDPKGKATAKDEEQRLVSADGESIAQVIRKQQAQLIAPFAQARAAGVLVKNMQWGTRLTPDEARAYEGVAQANGLSILNGTAYVLGGNLYCSLQGRLKIAHESGTFLGFSVDRMMTKEEREAYLLNDGEVGWITTADRSVKAASGEGTIAKFSDFGHASKTDKNPVAKSYPLEMAMKRARARALKLAYPVGLQSIEEVLDAEFMAHPSPPKANPADFARPQDSIPVEEAHQSPPESEMPEPIHVTIGEGEKIADVAAGAVQAVAQNVLDATVQHHRGERLNRWEKVDFLAVAEELLADQARVAGLHRAELHKKLISDGVDAVVQGLGLDAADWAQRYEAGLVEAEEEGGAK